MAKLLREFIGLNYDKNKILEAKEQKKPIQLQGIFQKCDERNQNGRIYPRSVLEREVKNYMGAVEEARALGELDHPESSVINLKNASHIVREIHWEGNNVCGTLEVLNTPSGKILESLLESGVKIGISSRGVGETTKTNEGADMVNDDFVMICFDTVSEPSTVGAWLNLREGKEVNLNEVQKNFTKKDRLYRLVNEILNKK